MGENEQNLQCKYNDPRPMSKKKKARVDAAIAALDQGSISADEFFAKFVIALEMKRK